MIAIRLAGTGALQLQRVTWGESNKASLRVRSWCRPSRVWGSVTPVALDRNPGNLHDDSPERRRKAFEEAQATVRSAVSRVVFRSGDDAAVEPEQVDVLRSCVVAGTAKPRAYPRFPHDTSRPQRVLVHVRLVFSESVRGPLLLGAGRYQGLGLCLPLDPLAGGREGSS